MEVDCPPFVKLEALTCSGDSKGSYVVHPRLLAGRKLAPLLCAQFHVQVRLVNIYGRITFSQQYFKR